MDWAEAFESSSRHIGKTTIGKSWVSTVFLGFDHSFQGGPPVLFETMVFGGDMDEYQWRYCPYDQAEKGHLAICNQIRESDIGKIFSQLLNIIICAFLSASVVLGLMLWL